jgi:hypothetical protein
MKWIRFLQCNENIPKENNPKILRKLLIPEFIVGIIWKFSSSRVIFLLVINCNSKKYFLSALLLFSLNFQTEDSMHRTPTSLVYVPLCRLRTREPITRLTRQQPKHFVVTSFSLLFDIIKLRAHHHKTANNTAVNVLP